MEPLFLFGKSLLHYLSPEEIDELSISTMLAERSVLNVVPKVPGSGGASPACLDLRITLLRVPEAHYEEASRKLENW